MRILERFLYYFRLNDEDEEMYEEDTLEEELNDLDTSFTTHLLHLIDERGLKDSVVYKRANMDRRLFSKVRKGDYVPCKKTILSLAFALRLSLEDAQVLLGKAGYTLSNSSRYDVIIMWLINHEMFNLNVANSVLYEYGERPLTR